MAKTYSKGCYETLDAAQVSLKSSKHIQLKGFMLNEAFVWHVNGTISVMVYTCDMPL